MGVGEEKDIFDEMSLILLMYNIYLRMELSLQG